jgi:hypothetical protein
MTYGHTDNKTSRRLNKAGFLSRVSGPSAKQNAKWHQEFLDSGAQFKMSFVTFKNIKMVEWYKEKNRKTKKSKNRVKGSPQII